MLYVKTAKGRYRLARALEVLEHAAEYRAENIKGAALTSPQATRDFLRQQIGHRPHEVFASLLLDNRHRVIEYKELFRGTIDGANVYPREIVKEVLAANAAAVIITHNHPSGDTTPSTADELITKRIREALALVDVRLLDHVIVSETSYASFAERGLL